MMQVFEHAAGRAALLVDRRRIPIEADAQVDATVVAERPDRLSRPGVERVQDIVRAEDQTAILAVLALPVVDTARVESRDGLARPELLSGRRVERHERVLRAAREDGAAHDERIEIGLTRRVRPRDGQPAHVGLRDPGRGDEPRAVRTARIVAPLALAAGRNRAARHAGRREQHRWRDDARDPPQAQGPLAGHR